MTYLEKLDNFSIKLKYHIKYLKTVFKQFYVIILIILALASFNSFNTSFGLNFLIRG